MSLTTPPRIAEEKPKQVKEAALRIAYWDLNVGKTFWKKTGANAVTMTLAKDLTKPAINIFLHTGF